MWGKAPVELTPCGVSLVVLLSSIVCDLEGAAPIPVIEGLKRIALTGDPVPGKPGRQFHQFEAPDINVKGQVAFTATLNCCFPTHGVFSTGGGNLDLVAFERSPAESGGTITFTGFDVQLDNLGRTLIRGEMTDLPPEFDAIWVGQENQMLTRVVISGQVVNPAIPGTTYHGIDYPNLGSGGILAGRGVTKTGSSVASGSDVLFKSDGTGLAQPILQAGDQLDFLPQGVLIGTYFDQAIENPVVNNSGQIAVRTATVDTRGSEVEPFGSHILLIEPNDTYSNVVSYGEPALQLPGQQFGALSIPVINDRGAVGFAAFVGPASGFTGHTIWRKYPGENAELIVRRQSEAPGMPGVLFDSLFFNDDSEMPLWITNRGDVAFWAGLVGEPLGPNFAESVWIGSPNNLRAIIVEGQEAPGTGGVFASMSSTIGDMVLDMAVNNNSQLAILALTTTPSGQHRDGLFATDLDGNLRKIAAYGDWIEVAPGDVRQVFSIAFEGDAGERRGTGLNDRGEVAFRAFFMDGTHGVFISSAVAVPEPSAWVLILAALVAGMRIYRKQPFRNNVLALTKKLSLCLHCQLGHEKWSGRAGYSSRKSALCGKPVAELAVGRTQSDETFVAVHGSAGGMSSSVLRRGHVAWRESMPTKTRACHTSAYCFPSLTSRSPIRTFHSSLFPFNSGAYMP